MHATAKIAAQLDATASCRLPRSHYWTRKRWLLTLAAAGCAFILLLGIWIPNYFRSKMAANEDITEQQAKVFSNSIPGSAITAQKSTGFDSLVTLATPGAAADSNGLFHGLGDHVENSFSLDGHSLSDQQSRVFTGPMIARTVSLSLVVKDFDASRSGLDAILVRHSGHSANLTVNTPQGAPRSLQASLRVPTSELAATISELKALGHVEIETQSGEEVTRQHADLVARLKVSRETERRFLAILRERTGNVNEVLNAEQAIARVRGEIEQMEAEQKDVEHRVDFATIDLKLAEEYKAQLTSPTPSAGMQLRNAIVDGFRKASESLLSVILFLAESGPTLLLWVAILFFPARLLWRRYRRMHVLGSLGGA
jgi:hypothetical protein